MNQEQGIANQKLFGSRSARDGKSENRVILVHVLRDPPVLVGDTLDHFNRLRLANLPGFAWRVRNHLAY
jgi:hypothetical protein